VDYEIRLDNSHQTPKALSQQVLQAQRVVHVFATPSSNPLATYHCSKKQTEHGQATLQEFATTVAQPVQSLSQQES
jgi:hypothetical protein